MRITAELLTKHAACMEQLKIFKREWTNGCQPTVENMSLGAALGLDVWWLCNLLPKEGPGSQRAYALWCAKQVEHLMKDDRSTQCLQIVERRVVAPESVSDNELSAAKDAAWAAARDAAWAAASAAARAAAWDAARDAARDAQLACLSQLLMEV
jgi:hypothetical protein